MQLIHYVSAFESKWSDRFERGWYTACREEDSACGMTSPPWSGR